MKSPEYPLRGFSWNDELDLDAETIYEDGVLIETQKSPDLNHLLAYQLLLARESANITQKELADGLDMELRIDFIKKF